MGAKIKGLLVLLGQLRPGEEALPGLGPSFHRRGCSGLAALPPWLAPLANVIGMPDPATEEVVPGGADAPGEIAARESL